MAAERLDVRTILRVIVTVVAVAALLYLLYLLRRPIGWLIIAAFVAVALTAPVELLARRIPRPAAIGSVYVALILFPVAVGALLVPPIVEQATDLARDIPEYVRDGREFLEGSDWYQDLEERYGVGERLEELAADAPDHLGDAAGTLSSIGFGVVNSLFAIFTILVLSAFMVASGPRWTRSALSLVPAEHRARSQRTLRRIAAAVAGYVRAQLTIAFVAAVLGYLVMTLLGVPFREPLAVVIGLASLIPVVGAPLWAVIVGLVTLTADFPTTTILWVIWAVAYPQFENYVLQPQLQKRAVEVEPFVIIVAVLFGGTLLGIVGALLAIPAAASIQIALQEWWAWQQESRTTDTEVVAGEPPPGAAAGEPLPE